MTGEQDNDFKSQFQYFKSLTWYQRLKRTSSLRARSIVSPLKRNNFKTPSRIPQTPALKCWYHLCNKSPWETEIYKAWQQLHRDLKYLFLTQEYNKLKLSQLRVALKSNHCFLSKQPSDIYIFFIPFCSYYKTVRSTFLGQLFTHK